MSHSSAAESSSSARHSSLNVAAAEVAEQFPGTNVTVLSRDRPGWMMSEPARAYLDRALERLGVRVRSGVEITKVLPDGVEPAGGEIVPAASVVWTTGFHVPPLAADAGLAVDERGRIRVDATLRSVSHPEVYAVGVAAAIRQSWGMIHGTCQSGIPTGAYAADAIDARLRGRTPKPFRFGCIHQPVSLGRRDAVIQFTRADDTPRRFYLTGRLPILYKQTVSSGPPHFFRMSKRVNLPPAVLSARGGRANRNGGAQGGHRAARTSRRQRIVSSAPGPAASAVSSGSTISPVDGSTTRASSGRPVRRCTSSSGCPSG
ncbi:FAD-dependent oxidoreductase [Actinoplanes sp. NPDC026619]|uniref:NAD(P)/FAD-dependent oxidoreductase n=1 Tax=Actinoplanes sp. NPDC026619 TaxID=3155798 RepID=UPI0033D221D3